MNKAKSIVVKLAAVAVIASGVTLTAITPSFADGGGSIVTSSDGRYQPMSGDRLAVYPKDASVEVWGVDNEANGVYLTTFSLDELVAGNATHVTESGTVTLHLDTPATFTYAYADYSATELSKFTASDAQYTISWADGNYGANGVGSFAKTFVSTYSK